MAGLIEVIGLAVIVFVGTCSTDVAAYESSQAILFSVLTIVLVELRSIALTIQKAEAKSARTRLDLKYILLSNLLYEDQEGEKFCLKREFIKL